MSNFLITGVNLKNKGSQSMFFITIDEIQKREKNAKIYYTGDDKLKLTVSNINYFYYSEIAKKIAITNNYFFKSYLIIKTFIKDLIKYLIGRRKNLWKFLYVDKNIKTIDYIINISGFNLGDKWSTKIQESYIDNIKLAKKYNIPTYLMPQSFGPFNNYQNRKKLLNEINVYLKYPNIIFAREKDGYQQLKELFKLSNVKLSNDLVLQNQKINIENIFENYAEKYLPKVKSNSVAIVPNKQCFNYGNENSIIEIYKTIIDELIEKNFNVYLFRHSEEDLIICQKLKSLYLNNSKVILLENNFSCIEYDKFVKNFKFIICSRYHGLVHSYKNYIPCIVLGWAIKYYELVCNLNQEKYMFDITDNSINISDIIKSINDMIDNLEINKSIIKEKVLNIQKCNCFDEVFHDIQQSK